MKLAVGVGMLVAVSVIAPAAACAAVSGADEYTVRGPSASGKGNTGAAPVAHPENLSPEAQAALAGQPDAEELTKAATSPELGAPTPNAAALPVAATDDDSSSVPGAVSDALGGASWALVIVGVALAGGAVYASRRRHGAPS